ncbi:MAG: GAF domain-containing protein, partial [Desulfobacteraceae bacterium]|nr:GAF domain-containing protein [Desulfobacteraceae bacterium]
MSDKPSYEELESYIEKLEEKVFKKLRAEKINQVLIYISNAVNTVSSFDELYKSIHNALSRLMDMTNFYIAMYYKELNAIQFVYARDEFDQQYEYIENFTENRSLTGDIILSKKPMFLTEDLLKALKKQERIKGTIPKIWLGVPLMIKKEVLGVMAVQSYDNPNQFTYKDLEVLSFVSGQIAVSIEKKRMETSLQQREEHFRTLFEGANDGIFILDQGRFSDCNQRTLEIFGLKSKEDLKGLMPKAISPENQPDGRVSKSAYALYIDQTLKGDPQQFYWLHNK